MSAATTDLHTSFAFDLLRATAVDAGPGGSVVVSPWSVTSALAVLAPGTDRAARREIEQALASSTRGESPADLAEALAADAHILAESRASDALAPGGGDAEDKDDEAGHDGDTLVVANTLWVDDGRTPQPTFVSALGRWPGAAVRIAPMAQDPEAARDAVNADVAGTTRGLIPEILPAGSITGDDAAVVVNALYLLAGWLERFSVEDTVDEPFEAASGRRGTPTMRARHELRYAPGDWQYLGLPLWPDLVAEILVPPAGEAVTASTAAPRATSAVLRDRRDRARRHRVDLHLPRFRVETHLDLVPPLRRLGLNRIFDDPTAVPGVVVDEPLWISGAFHAAVLRADERGIEGAAATALVARAVAFVDLPEVEVRIDRPFLVLVTHRSTGIVPFVAHVTEP